MTALTAPGSSPRSTARAQAHEGRSGVALVAEGAGDDLLHDLRGATVDALDAGVEPGTRHRILLHVAVPAVQLQALVGHPAQHLRVPQLAGRGAHRIEAPVQPLAEQAVAQRAPGLQVGPQRGQLEAGVLEVGDPLTERGAVLDVGHRLREHRFGTRLALHRRSAAAPAAAPPSSSRSPCRAHRAGDRPARAPGRRTARPCPAHAGRPWAGCARA